MKTCWIVLSLTLGLAFGISKVSHSQSQTAIDGIQKKFDDIHSLYLLGHNLLNEFDAFDPSVLNPLQTDTYARLQAVRVLRDGIRAQLTEAYGVMNLTELRKFGENLVGTLKGLSANEALEAKIKLIALYDVAIDLGEAIRSKNKVGLPGLANYEQIYLGGKDAISKFTALGSATRQALDIRAREHRNLLLQALINSIAEGLKRDFESAHEPQEAAKAVIPCPGYPESSIIYPSTDSHGNITGNTFPVHTWALTYDDGPSTKFTAQALQNLQAHRMKATFFWLTMNGILPANKKIIDDARLGGMALAVHSWTHPEMPKQNDATLKKEIIDATDKLGELYGSVPRFYRLPYGAGTGVQKIRKMIADKCLVHAFWNVDSLDWQDKNPESILARVQKQMNAQHKGIILFHDIHSQSITATNMLMDWIKTQSAIRMVTLPEIVDEINSKPL